MERIYTKQDATEKMLKSCKYYEVRIKAWESVKRVFKKDGSNFKNINMCFEGATVTTGNPYETRIYINFRDENGSYCEDYYIVRNDGHNVENATADDVQRTIEKAIENYKKWLEKDAAGTVMIERQIDRMQPLLDELKEQLKAAEEVNTHYTLKSYIKNYLGILNEY